MVVITRVVNASAVIEFNEGAVLTDPYFTDHWFMRFNEPIGVRDLPNLAAIIGSHSVFDRWQPSSLTDYQLKAETPVFVATPSMRESSQGRTRQSRNSRLGRGARNCSRSLA